MENSKSEDGDLNGILSTYQIVDVEDIKKYRLNNHFHIYLNFNNPFHIKEKKMLKKSRYCFLIKPLRIDSYFHCALSIDWFFQKFSSRKKFSSSKREELVKSWICRMNVTDSKMKLKGFALNMVVVMMLRFEAHRI